MNNLFEMLNNSEFDFFFLVVDEFLNIRIPELTNFYSIYEPNLATKNSGFLLSLPSTQDFIEKTIAQSGHRAAIIPFKPSAKIDLICRQKNWTSISNPAPINRLLEDKIKFSQICTEFNLPTIPTIIDTFSPKTYEAAKQKLGDILVVQTHFGWAGNSSHLTENYSDLVDKIPQNTIVKFSPYQKGYSLTNNCCQTSRGLFQSPLGLQYTGLKPLTTNPLATVGRQWPSHVPKNIQDQAQSITTAFSQILTKYNYKGFFGLDFFVSSNKVYLLECNPRLTASFAFYTQMEINADITPLFLLHLAEFINLDVQNINYSQTDLVGSEITLKNETGATVGKYNDFVAFSPTYDPVSIPPQIIAKLK